MDDQNGNIDISIIIIYFCGVLLIGYLIGRKARTGDDLFLGGRSLTWGFIGFSLLVSDISSTALVGLAVTTKILSLLKGFNNERQL